MSRSRPTLFAHLLKTFKGFVGPVPASLSARDEEASNQSKHSAIENGAILDSTTESRKTSQKKRKNDQTVVVDENKTDENEEKVEEKEKEQEKENEKDENLADQIPPTKQRRVLLAPKTIIPSSPPIPNELTASSIATNPQPKSKSKSTPNALSEISIASTRERKQVDYMILPRCCNNFSI